MNKREPKNSHNGADSGGFEIYPSGRLAISQSSDRVEVVAAVIVNESGQFLLAQRPAGKVYAGYWEFPGGKVEAGETAEDALRRELHEELGIHVITAHPWLTRDFDYAHAAVRLRFFRVLKWSDKLHGKEQQQFVWQASKNVTVTPLLPANGPVLRALELPTLYGISNAAELGVDGFLGRLECALSGGLRLIQIREKQLSADAQRALALEAVKIAHRHDARALLNGSVSLAQQVGADGVHLTSAHLLRLNSRPSFELVGASCHNAEELARAAALGVDYVVLGAVLPTPSHPGAAGMGWQRFAALVRDYELPVYAIGGLNHSHLETAWRAGAHGISMVRAAWQ